MATPTAASNHILVVDDQPEIRLLLRRAFEDEGFIVNEAAGRAQLWQCLDTMAVDLITLDLDLGAENGLELALEIRGRHNVPIIMITGKSEAADRLTGLEYGADDYITKPFKLREVILRVRSVLRRYELEARIEQIDEIATGAVGRYRFDAGVLDVARREFRNPDGDIVGLTESELDLLVMFVRNPGRILSRDQMMELLRGRSWSPLERTIDGHVARLRQKIEPDGPERRLIKSVRSVGYVLAADIERLD